MAGGIYLLCSLAGFGCATLLLRSFSRSGLRLLFWSGVCFLCLGLNNALVFTDLVLLPHMDLFLWRNLAAAAGISLLIYGLVWDSDR
jgi:Family of unknown function (DUF5985)